MKIILNDDDYNVIAAYKAQVERKRGYTGPIFISLERLADIHMHSVELAVKAYFARQRVLGLYLRQQEIAAMKRELQQMLNVYKGGDANDNR